MGCSLSGQQEAQLVAHLCQVAILLDGDGPGRRGAQEITARLAPKLWVRVMNLPDGQQPDQVSTEDLQRVLAAL
jgi:DNA primase